MPICKTCEIDKDPDAFAVQKSKRSGLFAECKACQRTRNQNWIDNNRDRFREMNRRATSEKRRRNPVRNLLSLARARCKKSGLDFTITEADLLVPELCPVLGIPLSFGLGCGDGHSLAVKDRRASIDRIDNSKGYIPGNVIVVSYRANRIKSDASTAELFSIARFYGQLDTNKDRQATVPGVQPQPEEQEGPMLKRVA